MKQQARTASMRYAAIGTAVALITIVNRRLQFNPTTVALMFLVIVLLVSAYWGLRYAVALALAAAAVFNFFFLPPYGTFSIEDPQNWIAFCVFLVTALVASNLSERARKEALEAEQRRYEVERLYALSQRLLSVDNVAELRNALPGLLAESFRLSGAALLSSDQVPIYRSRPDVQFDENALRMAVARGEPTASGNVSYVPLHIGAKVVGALALCGAVLSRETLEAIGSLAGLAAERTRAVEELTANRAMQQNERLRTALLDSVAHEFRTPLTGIKASVTSLLSSHDSYDFDEASRNELLTIINEETDRLNRLVGDAAEVARLDAGMVKLNVRSCRVRDVVDAAIESTSSRLNGHPVVVMIGDDVPNIKADFERIREVLQQLLDNAAKYSPEDAPIRVTAERNAGSVMISVADRGPGIDAFEQSLIFDKFYRGREQRNLASGTGMGLAIAKIIVEAHGGTLGVVSQPGRGSVFSFTLSAMS